MSTSRMEQLHSFLTEEGRELDNVKFFPGTARGLTSDQISEETLVSVKRAFEGGLVDCPPVSGRQKSSL